MVRLRSGFQQINYLNSSEDVYIDMLLISLIGFAIALILSIGFTPLVRKLAFKVGAVDKPNARKVHSRMMPRLGGLAIFAAFILTFPLISNSEYDKPNISLGLILGSIVIVIIGSLDDRFELSAKWKLLGQIVAASIVVSFGVQVNLLNLPFGEHMISIGWLSIPITILWIVGVTNAINLIDGLDGLAAGVSSIATGTILALAIMMGNVYIILLSSILLGSILGFLVFNFHPAKIFMGDSGALFLGFTLATLSVLGFKQATVISFIIPLLILGVPISDTFFAILRRRITKTPISVADKGHLHHCLLRIGFSHRTTVLIIYGIATLFGLSAVLLSQSNLWLSIVLICLIILGIEVGGEMIGIMTKRRRPVLRFFRKVRIFAEQSKLLPPK